MVSKSEQFNLSRYSKMSKNKAKKISVLSHAYSSLLKELGYEVEDVFDDSVFFIYDGYYYRLRFDQKIDGFLSVDFGVSMDIDNENRARLHESINLANQTFAVVKATVSENSIDLACEAWISDREVVGDFIGKSVKAINEAFDQIYEELSDDFKKE